MKKEMYTVVETISPERAKYILQTSNASNRKLRETVVARYAEDMKNGKWELTGQTITFDMDGILKDGQHRLSAIVKSGVPVKLNVCYNAPNTINYDSGLQRSAGDQFKMGGYAEIYSNPMTVAIIKMLYSLGNKSKPTTSQIEEFISNNKIALEHCISLYGGRVANFIKAPQVSACFCAISSEYNLDKIKRFYDVLKTGLYNSDSELPIIAFRNYLINNSGKSGMTARKEIFKKCESALYNYDKNTKVTRIYEFKNFIYFNDEMI